MWGERGGIEEFLDGFTGVGGLLDAFPDDGGDGGFAEGDEGDLARGEFGGGRVGERGGVFAEEAGGDELVEHSKYFTMGLGGD